MEIVELNSGVNYPNLIFSKGQIPSTVPEKKFKAEKRFDEENEDDELGNYNEYDDFYN